MDREIFCFSSSMAVILASTIWPSDRTSLGLVDAAVSNLGNVDQAVHAGHDLGKGAEGHQLDDADSGHVAHLVLVHEHVPRGRWLWSFTPREIFFFSGSKEMTYTSTVSPTLHHLGGVS